MKKVFAIALVVFVASCNTPEKLLCRSWRLVDVEFNEHDVNLSTADKPEMVKQLRDSCLFVFNKDHTYSMKLPQRTETGVWNFSSKKDTIYSQTEHSGTASKINVLSKIALDVESYSKDGVKMRFVLAPVENKSK
ncbi:MAG TPA: hypothetical protein VK174_16305 [Chitinophagales bacterium]|nr:hypothetical protein [Chitinophagales bacterium]